MTTAQWERAKDVTADALELEPDARAGFILQACGDDADVHREVRRLLAEAAASGCDFLSSPPFRVPALLVREPELSPTFSPGQSLASRFRIERFVSRGGMGEVYAATDLELKEVVALKTIRPAISYSAAAIENFKREVSQSRRITHPNVCHVYELFSHQVPSGESLWFLTMELLDGPTLADRITTEGPLRIDQAVPLIRNVVAAVDAAHELGVVHRDLKPNNVMLVPSCDEPERAVVTDFGLALKLSAGQEGLDAGVGTPGYMAPEQATGDTVSLATDQFALGMLICKMLTGTLPELSRTSDADSRKQLSTWLRKQPRGAINFHLRKVISRCLRLHPQDRFREVREILPLMDGSRLRSRMRGLAMAAGIVTLFACAIAAVVPYADERVTGAVPLTAETGMSADANISADGKWIVYQSDSGEMGNLDVWIEPAVGGAARRLTTHPAIDSDPAVSPDGRLVAFRSERDRGGLYVINADGTGERLLASAGRNPAFSPDGRWIAYWTGTRDDVSPSGELYRVAPDGGSPVRLAAEFADARYPTWSPDGGFILFDGCRSSSATLSSCNDWWVIRADGRDASQTGALAIIRSRKIELQGQPTKTWRNNEVVFSGSSGSAVPLWALALSPKTHRVEGTPRQLTEGDARERDPAALNDGTIVFGRITGALHIWQVPLPGHSAIHGGRITNDAGLDGCPSVSRDGRWLYLNRKIGGVRHLLVTDLSTGRESQLLNNSDDKFWPVSSPTGNRVAVETRGPTGEAIWIVERDGRARKLCTGCSHPTSWFAGETAILYATSRGEIAEVDASTGRSRIILSPENGAVLGGAEWSAVQGYLLFTSTLHGSARQTFAVKYSESAKRPASDSTPIVAGSAELEQPHWSADGATIYFLSKLDGNNCVWGLGFDASRRRTVGKPFPVMHYHDSRRTPNMAAPISRGLTVSTDSVFLNAGEVTDTVWKGKLTGPSWLGGFSWRDHLTFLR
jgi:Tol biopolymer transport system component/tRNA A-37 threonylcarbamoyl transferase component Bud32